ncbi:tetratricopeptide repeat protein [Schaalia georgiae]|uniref:tetratricopeptide repeat protein n=1 Tax=Schaalia georgiae TaxID=52768 RepID=UPI0003FA831F|nr:tetratricopeptide repeat protein [Schaalia georgiae]
MDPVLVSVAGLGAPVVKFLLRASGQDTGASLVGDAQEGLVLLARLRGQVNDKNHAVAKRIEKTVAGRVRGMYQKCRDQGVGTECLDGVATEVERLLGRVAADESLVLEAVRFPDGFADLLHDLGDPIRAELFEWSEPYFNEIVDAVAGEYIRLAPWSPNFKIEALKYVMGALDRIEEGVDEVRLGVSKGLENDQVTHGKLDVLLARSDPSTTVDARPGRVLFGGRPDVASGFVERGEQGRLRSLVIDERQGRTVLVGMAGCGKSQLASALAQWCEEAGWGVVAWVSAETKAAVKSDLVELANRLGIDTNDKPTEDQMIRRCLDHLKSPALGDRLVIFDNVEDFEDLADLVPQGAGLRVVATARSREASSAWEPVEVEVLPRPDSIDLVQSIMGTQDEKAADAVAERLGDLPLALAQAAETARNKRWSLQEYLVRLEAFSSDRVIRRIPGDSYADDVSIALLMAADSALSHLKGDSRDAARRQLGALAVLAESGVPTHWLDPRADADKTDRDANARDDTAEDAHRALTALLNASEVQQSADGGVTMVHRLQAQVLRENWNPEEWTEAFDAAAGLLGQVNIDRLPRNNAEGRRRETLDLIDQLRAIAAQDYSHPLFEREQVRVCLHHAFRHANDLGLPYEVLTLRDAVSAVEDILGTNQPDTLSFHNNLALAYQRTGHICAAIAVFEDTLTQCRETLGAAHPVTLASQGHLADALRQGDRLSEALILLEDTLAYHRDILGPTHTDTLASQTNLALAYQDAGRLDEAIALDKDTLTIKRKVLGIRHPATLASQDNLALAYQAAGRFNEALVLHEDALVQHRKVLGPNHPDTLISAYNLATIYRMTGKLDQAIPLYEDTLIRRRKVLGPNHPDTLISACDLANAYFRKGKLEKAIPLYEDTLKRRRTDLGATDPETLRSQNNLAAAYRAAGRLAKAIALHEDTLTQLRKTLGNIHPDALASQYNLAYTYQAAGRLDDARALFKDTLEVCEEALSPGHPLTITVRENLETLERETNPATASSPESSEE